MNNDIKEILEKFDEEVKKVELIRNPYSNEDKKMKIVGIYLEEDHCNIFKDILDYITNLEQERDKFKLRCYKSLKLIRDNYGLLDKYGIDMLDDILTGGDEE